MIELRIPAFLILLCVCIPVPVLGQVVILHAAHMLDVEAGQMISPAVVVIDDKHIKSVNPKESTFRMNLHLKWR